MKRLADIRNLIFPVFQTRQYQLLELQQALSEWKIKANELAGTEKRLSRELQSIYSILIRRSHCRLSLFPLIQQETLLLAVETHINQINVYLYVPIQQSTEIAQVYTNIHQQSLVIHEFYVEAEYSKPFIHSFLLQQVKREAKRLGLSVVHDCLPCAF